MNETRVSSRRKRKKGQRKWLKIVLSIAALLVLATAAYGAYVFSKAKSALHNAQEDLDRTGGKSELREESVTLGKDPISLLLIGVETYATGGKDGRADTQIVVTLDPGKNEMTMVTVPRDTRVNIENAGTYTGIHKINAAYIYGALTDYGANKLQVETVEKLLNIPIDHYVAVDFDGFKQIVDTLGGVEIDIKEPFWEKNIFNNNKRIYFEQGPAHLNGEEALAFVRMRERPVNAVYSRDERQRQFLQATVDQAVSAGTLFKVGEISDILGEHVKTDLSAGDIYSLQKQYSKLTKSSIKTNEIKGVDRKINKASYFIPDRASLEDVSKQLRINLGLQPEEFKTNADFAGY